MEELITLDYLYLRQRLDFSPNHMVDYSNWRVLKVGEGDSSEIKVAMNFFETFPECSVQKKKQ